MNIGGLTIEMAADLARLRQDMEGARKSVGDAMAGIEQAVNLAKAAFIGYLGVASVNAFKGMVMGAIDATGALHDMAQQTGNSAAALAQFKSIGSYSETSLDSIAAASLKLSKNLALTDEEGKGAALALKAMGVDFDSFVKMNPDQRMLTAAKALNQYEDGADKSAAAMLLFGKEGAKMLPFLADLGDQADQVTAKLDAQSVATKKLQADMADAFGDNLTKISKNSEAWKKDISLGLLPAMYEASEAFLKMTGGAGGLKAKISELSKDGTLAEWAREAMTALSYLADVVQGLFSLLPMLGKVIAGVAAGSVELFSNMGEAVSKVMKGDFSGALDSMKSGFKAVSTIGSATAEDVSKIWNQKLIGETFRDTMSSLRGVQAESSAAKKQLNLVDVLKANEAAKKAEAEASKLAAEEQKKLIAMYEAADKAGQELVNALALKNAQLELEAELGRKLTPVEAENLKLTNELASGKILLSQADEEAARAAIEHGAALEREIAWQQEAHKSNLALIDSTDKRIEQLRDETAKQHEANGELLLSAQQIGEVRRAKLEDLAVQADRKAALLDEIDWTGQLGDQQRELAKAYRDSAAVAGEGAAAKAAKEAQDAWQKTIDSIGNGLSDSLFRAFESGKGFFKTLWDGIVNTFKTTALKLVISGVDGKGGIVGTVLGAFGLGSGGSSGGVSGTSTGSILGSLGSLASMGKSAWGMLAGSGGAGAGSLLYANAVGSVGGDSLGALISANAGNWGVSVGAGAAAEGGAAAGGTAAGGAAGGGAGAGLAAYWPLAVIAGMIASGSAYGQGFNQNNLPPIAQVLFPEHKFDTNMLVKLGLSERFANIISGTSLTSKLLHWGGGLPHQGAGIYSDGTTATNVKNAAFGLGGAQGDSVNKYYSQTIADALTPISTGAAGLLNELSKAFGGKGDFGVGTYFASDGNRGSNWGRSVLRNGVVQSYFSGGDLAADPAQGLQQLTAALAGQVKDAMGLIDMPQWAKDQIKGLASTATLDDLVTLVGSIENTKAALADMGTVFSPLGGAFSQIAGLSSDAQMSLVKLAGGIDKLTASAENYVSLYYTDKEQAGLKAVGIRKTLADTGIDAATLDALGTKEQFRQLVDRTDVSTEQGRKQLIALLGVASDFADVAKVLADVGGTLGTVVSAVPSATQIVGLLKDPTQASAQAAEQSNALLQTATDQLSTISSNGAASVAVQQAGFQQLIDKVDALSTALQEVVRPGMLTELAR